MTQEERINFWSEEVGCPPKTSQENRCRYCTEFEDLPEHIINGTPVGKVFDTSKIKMKMDGIFACQVVLT